MARNAVGRIEVSGMLVADSPIHVGTLGPGIGTDMPIARDGQGRAYIPGTSLAGPIRAWWEAVFDNADAETWFGERGNPTCASHVVIGDAVLAAPQLPQPLLIEIRNGVGIDRVRGVAADRIKYDRAVLPKGTKMKFSLTGEAQDDTAKAELSERLRALMRDLAAGRVAFGAAKNGGLGRVHRETGTSFAWREYDVKTRAGILNLVRNSGTLTPYNQLPAAGLTAVLSPSVLRIEVDWRPGGAVMQKAAYEGEIEDIVPLTMAADPSGNQVQLGLQGAGIKGALRTQAERIVRTCLPDRDAPDDFLEQVRLPLVDDVFGAAPRRRTVGGRRGALGVDDVRSIQNYQPDIEKTAGFKGQDHIAIDRFLGGAADQYLFNVLEPPSDASYGPIKLVLRPDRLSDGLQLPALALLCLVLDDLARGRIALGFGGSRDKGVVIVRRVRIGEEGAVAATLKAVVAALTALPNWNGRISTMPAPAQAALREAWTTWLQHTETPQMAEGAQ